MDAPAGEDAADSIDGSTLTLDGAPLDGGLGLCSEATPEPILDPPPCSADARACYLRCTDFDCVYGCLVSASSLCAVCIIGQIDRCGSEACPEEQRTFDCCWTELCRGAPGTCTSCDAQKEVYDTCAEAAYLSHCVAWLDQCFPGSP